MNSKLNKDIAIIGMSCQFPNAKNYHEYWENLINGESCISEVPTERWDWKKIHGNPLKEKNKCDCKWGGFLDDINTFDPAFFKISPKEAMLIDPQQRIMLQNVWSTIEDAGYKPSTLAGSSTGVFIGVSTKDYDTYILDAEKVESHGTMGHAHTIHANRISYLLNLTGPSEVIDTACSSSLISIHRAVTAIQCGDCEMAIAGGVNAMLSPYLFISFSRSGMLSNTGSCKSFDEKADGYVRGEGVGSVLLKPLDQALKDNDDIYGVIKGSAVNHGGAANTLTSPNMYAQSQVIQTALDRAGVTPDTISYIEAHGTGTPLGDPIEIHALKRAFKASARKSGVKLDKQYCAIGTAKTNIGHLEAAAGIAGVIKTLLSMRYRKLPKLQNHKNTNPKISLENSPFYLLEKNGDWGDSTQSTAPLTSQQSLVRAGVSSFGFGGSNAHIILESYARQPIVEKEQSDLFVLSARTQKQLREQVINFRTFLLSKELNASFHQVCNTSRVGREPFRFRFSTVAHTLHDLVSQLEHYINNNTEGTDSKAHSDTEEYAKATVHALESRDLHELSKLWIRGAEIDFEQIDTQMHRCSLPTYPFAKDRYWVPKGEKPTWKESSPLFLSENSIESPATTENKSVAPSTQINSSPAVVIARSSHLKDLTVKPITIPEPAADEVQILVKCFSLNFGDLLCVKGFYPTMPPYPFTPGFEVSGIILKTGSNVTEFTPGDSVIALTGKNLGGHSSLVNTLHHYCIPKPEFLDYSEAASLPTVYLTISEAFDKAQPQRGEKILIQSAAGGVGLAAIQRAQKLGLEIYATVSTPEKIEYLHNLGVTHCINYTEEDFEAAIRKLTNGYGVDIVINSQPGEAIQKGMNLLAPEGRYIELAATALLNSKKLDLSCLCENQSIYLLDLRKSMLRNPERVRPKLMKMVQEIEADQTRPITIQRFNFSDIQKAYLLLDAKTSIGKVVIENSSDLLSVNNQLVHVSNIHGSATPPQPKTIAIVGMSVRVPGASTPQQYWNNLVQGVSSIKTVPGSRWAMDKYFSTNKEKKNCTYSKWGGFIDGIDEFDAPFFKISPIEAKLMEPMQRIAVQECWKAFEDSAIHPDQLDGSRCGVYLGVSGSDYHWKMLMEESEIKPHTFTGNISSIVASRISNLLNLKGPNVSIETACSSSLVALHQAARSIQVGDCDTAVAGGIFITTTPFFYILCSKAGILSPTGQSRPFDNSADGFVPGEGSGVFILKSLEQAEKDGDHIYATIKGTGINQDGRTKGISMPNGEAQSQLQSDVYEKNSIDPGKITYVESHGTGTPVGDPIEFNALSASFKKSTSKTNYCALGSVKANIGHLSVAAGAAGVAKVLLAMKHKTIPPHIGYSDCNSAIDLENSPFYINQEARAWNTPSDTPRMAALSSYGLSGTNAHLVLEEYSKAPQKNVPTIPQLFILSATNKEALIRYASLYVNYLNTEENIIFDDIIYTLQETRIALKHRLAIPCSNTADLTGSLKTFIATGANNTTLFYGSIDSQPVTPSITPSSAPSNTPSLTQAAAQWVAGDTIVFRSVHQNYGTKTHLPTYPFDKKSYWVGTVPAPSRPSPVQNIIQPLNDVLPHREEKHSITLTGNEYFLTDHVVLDKSILPGVAYLDFVLTAARSEFPHENISEFGSIEWLSPITVTDTNPVTIAIRFAEDDGQNIHFSIIDTNRGTLHSQGTIIRSTHTPPPDSINLKDIYAECTHRIEGSTLYNEYEKAGICYGPSFRVINHTLSSNNRVIAKLSLAETALKDYQNHIIAPSLMDGALQSILSLVLGEFTTNLYLPQSLKQCVVYSPIPESCYAVIEQVSTDNLETHYTIHITDSNGTPCVSLKGFKGAAIPHPSRNDASIYFTPHWQKTDRDTMVTKEIISPEKPILVVCTREEEPLLHLFEGRNKTVIYLDTVNKTLGEKEHSLDAQDSNSWELLPDSITEIQHLYYLAGVNHEFNASTSVKSVENVSVVNFYRMTRHFISRKAIKTGMNILLLTKNSHSIAPNERINPFTSASKGFLRSLCKEYRGCIANVLDISDLQNKEEEALIASLLSRKWLSSDNATGLRGITLYQHGMIPVSFNKQEHTSFRKGGVYCILGGAGGIGLETAQYLAKKYRAKIILIGRSQLSPTTEKKLDVLRQLGGEALYIQANGSSETEMRHAIHLAKKRFNIIHGVIHSALVLRDIPIKDMEEHALSESIEPKISASMILGKVFSEEPLDFMLFYSSAQSFWCNFGQSNYAAGCVFKDSHAQYLNQTSSYPVKTVNWGYWGTVGVVATKEYQQKMEDYGIFSIDVHTGMQTLEILLANSIDQLITIKASDTLLDHFGRFTTTQKLIAPASPIHLCEGAVCATRNSLVKTPIDSVLNGFTGYEQIDLYTAHRLLETFQTHGFFKNTALSVTPKELIHELTITDSYVRQFHALLNLLEHTQLLKEYNGSYTLAQQNTLRETTIELIQETYPEFTSHLTLVETCLESIFPILQGKETAVDIMFPGGSMKLVEGIYKNGSVNKYYNTIISEYISRYVKEWLASRVGDKKIRILEVGAGTGGTSRFVLESLKEFAKDIEYIYSDVSLGFTKYGNATFGAQYPFMKSTVLNIEKILPFQNIEENSIDLIIGSNVVHATNTIHTTTTNLSAVLKEGGSLALFELTSFRALTTVTFGLLDGWWAFEDPEFRIPDSPLLNLEMWEKILRSSGFDSVIPLNIHDAGAGTEFPIHESVITARKQQNTITSSFYDNAVFTIQGDFSRTTFTVSPETTPCLMDHVVFNQCLMPSDAYIEMLHVIALKQFGYHALSITTMQVQRPFIVNHGETAHVRVTINGKNKELNFAIESSKTTDFTTFTQHVKGTFSLSITQPSIHPGIIAEHQPKTDDFHIPHTEIYANDGEFYLGPFYQCIKAITIGEQSAISTIQSKRENLSQFHIDPSILDSAFLTAITSGQYYSGKYSKELDAFLLPVHFSGIEIMKPFEFDTYTCIVKPLNIATDSVTLSIDIYSSIEERYASIEKLELRWVHKSLIKAAQKNETVPASQQQEEHEVTEAISSALPTQHTLIDTLSQVFGRVLEIEDSEIDIEMPFDELGVDSILSIDIITQLDEQLSIELKPTDLFSHPTIRALAEFISNDTIPSGSVSTALPRLNTSNISDTPVISDTSGAQNDISVISKALSETLEIPISDIALTTPFDELGIDSILGIDIITRIQEDLPVEITAIDLFNYPTIEKLAVFIAEQRQEYQPSSKIISETAPPNRHMESTKTITPLPTSNISIQESVLRCFSDVLEIPLDTLVATMPFDELGVDSILGVDIATQLEACLDIEIQTIDLFKYPTINELSEYIAGLKPAEQINTREVNGVTYSILTIDGIEILTTGTGTPLVLIPGFGTTGTVFTPIIKKFMDSYTCYIIHYPGLGNSSFSLDENSIDRLTRVITSLNLPPFHLLGWSFGGFFAQALITPLQHTVISLILVNSSTRGLGMLSRFEIDAEKQSLEFLNNAFLNDIKTAIPDIQKQNAYIELISQSRDIQSQAAVFYFYDSEKFNKEAEMKKLTVNCLIISGENDNTILPKESDYLSRIIPHAQHHQIQGSGHFPFLSHQSEFCHVVNSFISKL